MCPSFKPMEILNSYQNFYHTVKNFASCTDDFVPVMNVITISEKGQSPMSSFWFLIACNLLYLFKCFLFYLHCLVDKNLILTLLKFPWTAQRVRGRPHGIMIWDGTDIHCCGNRSAVCGCGLEFWESFFCFLLRKFCLFPSSVREVTEGTLFLHVFLMADVWHSLQLLPCFPCLQILKWLLKVLGKDVLSNTSHSSMLGECKENGLQKMARLLCFSSITSPGLNEAGPASPTIFCP